jgi:TRAP-type C4-dicarboxylate transport system permease small subunit
MSSLLKSIHDRLTSASFAGATLCVAIITFSFVYEVVARYFFGAPTSWAYDVASYALCPMIFLSIPAMTQRNAHVAVSYLIDSVPAPYRAKAATLTLLVAAFVCFASAWITGAETWRQYVREVETISANPISKYWISMFIPYGLLLSALHFLRQFLGEAPASADGIGEQP